MDILTLSKEKFEKLLNGEKVYVGRKPLLYGHNIFSYQVGLLGKVGEVVDIPNYDKQLKLDESITFVERVIMYRDCVLNNSTEHNIFVSFVMMYPITDGCSSHESEMIKMLKENIVQLIK